MSGKRINHKVINGVEHKYCGKCHEWKTLDDYATDNKKWDGLNSWCKTCKKEHNKKFHEENYAKNKEKILNYLHEYYKNNKQYVKNRNAKYCNTKIGRAVRQVSSYRTMDKKRGLGDVNDFDGHWIVENIYSKPCVYCGETDWHKLGCNRIDNTKGHTKDNVEPCCYKCNCKMGIKYRLEK